MVGSQIDFYPKDTKDRQIVMADDFQGGLGQPLFAPVLETYADGKRQVVGAPTLAASDPWGPIYDVCIGRLPATPAPGLLEPNNLHPDLTFERFFDVDRPTVEGGLADLVGRITSLDQLTPRRACMVGLAYGYGASQGIRWEEDVLPDPRFDRHDAGPNILVVCSPGSTEDLALLWNLRAAHGDRYGTPIGVPVSDANIGVVGQLLEPGTIALHGLGHRLLYITSASLSVEQVRALLDPDGAPDGVAHARVVPPESLASLGPAPGIPDVQTVVWRNGESSVVPHIPKQVERLRQRGAFRFLRWYIDVSLEGEPLPALDDFRSDRIFEATICAGVLSKAISIDSKAPVRISLPSPFALLSSVAWLRGYECAESEPGRAARVLIERVGGIDGVGMLVHEPLLSLLQKMAVPKISNSSSTRWGVQEGEVPIAGNVDALTAEPASRFAKVLGGTKSAQAWIDWAEHAGLLLRGFALLCPNCDGRQWVPVEGFSYPPVCGGCSVPIDRPFRGESVKFKYRISEVLRRVFASSSMGHVLVSRYLAILFDDRSRIHPGLEISDRMTGQSTAEIDVVMQQPNGALVPVEVKSSFEFAAQEQELEHLDDVAKSLHAEWFGIAVTKYSNEDSSNMESLIRRSPGMPYRLVLTYDQLLDQMPIWPLGDDPFAWNPLEREAIAKREASFSKFVVDYRSDWRDRLDEEDLLKSIVIPE